MARPISPLLLLPHLLTLALLAGCQAPDEPTPRQGPTLASLRSRLPRPEVPAPPLEDMVRLRVARVALPIDRSLKAAWNLADRTPISAAVLGTLEGNAIRVGVIEMGAVETFVERMGQPLNIDWVSATLADEPIPLPIGPALHGEHVLLVEDAQGIARPEIFEGGRFQLLAESQRLGQATSLVLTPHHHRQGPRLLPRSARERQLEGRRLDDLAIHVMLDREHALVIAMDLPPVEEAAEQNEGEEAEQEDRARADQGEEEEGPLTEPDQAGASEDEDAPTKAQPPVNDRVGHLLLGGIHRGKPVQHVLIIAAHPMPSP